MLVRIKTWWSSYDTINILYCPSINVYSSRVGIQNDIFVQAEASIINFGLN